MKFLPSSVLMSFYLYLAICLNSFFLCTGTRPVVRDLVDGVITVNDEEIINAMKLCYEILKVAVEPSGAIGLAAVLSKSFKKNSAWKDCSNIGIILSGGNVDLGILWDAYKK